MKLVFENNCCWARLEGRINTDLLIALDETLSFPEPGYWFNPLFKRRLQIRATLFGWEKAPGKAWDGRRYLFNAETGRFPAGLSNRVGPLLARWGVCLGIEDNRPDPPWSEETGLGLRDDLLKGVRLAPDQLEAVLRATRGLRGCFCLATGAGKTEIAAALVKLAQPARCLFVVNKRTLLMQTAERFEERLGEWVGRLGAGYKETNRRVTVATIQTLYQHVQKFVGFLNNQNVLIVDEAHTIAPKTGFAVLSNIPSPVRIGLSATIREASRLMAIEAFLGPILMEGTLKELIDAGRAAHPTVKMVRVGGLVSETAEYHEAYQRGIVHNDQRNSLIIEAVKRYVEQGKQVLVLATLLPHGRHLSERISRILPNGQETEFLEGKTPLDVVNRAKANFERRRLPVLVASTIADFGWDMPSVEVLILAGGGKAPLRTIQRMGRAMRVKRTGENRVEILDLLDMSHRKLTEHAQMRRRTYQKKGFNPQICATVDEAIHCE